MNKKSSIVLIIVGCCLLVGSFPSSQASVVDGYYLQNFSPYSNGDTNFSWYDEGEQWGHYWSSDVDFSSIQMNKLRVYTTWNSNVNSARIYFDKPTTFVNYTFTYTLTAGNGDASHWTYFYNALGTRMFMIYFMNDYVSPGPSHYYYTLYGLTNATVVNTSTESGYGDCDGSYTIMFYPGNSSVRIIFDSSNNHLDYDKYISLGSAFDMTFSMKIVGYTQTSPTHDTLTYDNIYFLSGVENPWEIESDYHIGSLLQTHYANFSTTLIPVTENYMLVEKNPEMTYGSTELKQFAFAVATTTTLSTMTVLLHVNGEDLGYYDSAYYYAGGYNIAPRYILVWKDLDRNYPTSHLTIELLITLTGSPCIFSYPVYEGDIENDGVIDRYSSSGYTSDVLHFFNGIYDGIQHFTNTEPIYKMWLSGEGAGGDCGIDFSGYESIGSLLSDDPLLITSHFLEILYNVPVDLTLRGVQIVVDKDMGGLTYDYFLKVNGEPAGSADCVSSFTDYLYLVTWNFTTLIINEPVLFEFYSDSYWSVIKSDTALDDGEVGVKGHSSYTMWDGSYNGGNVGYDVSYQFYYHDFSFLNIISPYEDLLTSTKTDYITYENVVIQYLVSDVSYQNFIYLYHNGTRHDDQGYPILLDGGKTSGTVSYVPFHIGNYRFELERNAIIRASFNITVTRNPNEDFLLYLMPNPCDYLDTFMIGYRFFPDDGSEGLIMLGERRSMIHLSDAKQYWMIAPNTTGNLSYTADYPYYVNLYKDNNGTYYEVDSEHLMITIDNYRNWISVRDKQIVVENDGDTWMQLIGGAHTINYGQVVIKLNNYPVFDVTDEYFFTKYYEVDEAGSYNVTLVLESVNGSIVLAYDTFTFEIQNPEAEGGFGADMKTLFGVCCILISVCIPLMISVKYKTNVPTFVYVVFLAFGLALGYILGFLEMWIIFLFVVALVAGAVYTIFGHGGPGPGSGGGGGSFRERVFTRRGGTKKDEGTKKGGYGRGPSDRGY